MPEQRTTEQIIERARTAMCTHCPFVCIVLIAYIVRAVFVRSIIESLLISLFTIDWSKRFVYGKQKDWIFLVLCAQAMLACNFLMWFYRTIRSVVFGTAWIAFPSVFIIRERHCLRPFSTVRNRSFDLFVQKFWLKRRRRKSDRRRYSAGKEINSSHITDYSLNYIWHFNA